MGGREEGRRVRGRGAEREREGARGSKRERSSAGKGEAGHVCADERGETRALCGAPARECGRRAARGSRARPITAESSASG